MGWSDKFQDTVSKNTKSSSKWNNLVHLIKKIKNQEKICFIFTQSINL